MESLGSLNPLASSIKYIIEYDLGDGVHYIPLPYNPTSIRFTKQFATTVTPTLGKIPVIEHSGPRIVDVEIEGRTGLKERRQALDSEWWSPNNVFDGYGAFVKLYKALIDWETKAAGREAEINHRKNPLRLSYQGGAEGAKYQLDTQELSRSGGGMIIRALDEQIEYYVEPTQFTWFRAAKGPRFGYQYTLNLRGYGEATRLSQMTAVEKGFQAASKVTHNYDQVRRGITNLVAVAGDIGRIAGAGATKIRKISYTMTNFSGSLITTLARLKAVPSNYNSSLVEIGTRGKALWQEVITFFDDDELNSADNPQSAAIAESRMHDYLLFATPLVNAANAVAASTYRFLPMPNYPYKYFESQLEIEAKLGNEAMEGTLNDEGYDYSPGKTKGFNGGDCIFHTVQVGESLYEIAEKYYSSRANVGMLMLANPQLDEMYASDAGTPGFLEVGSVLVVPQPTKGKQGSVDANDPLVQSMFGIDLLLEDGDLKIKGTAKDDVALVRGYKNLRQGLLLKLTTYQGDNKVFPELGLPVRPGDPNSMESLAILLSEVKNQLVGDRRVSGIRDVQIVDGGDRLAIRCDVLPVAGDAIPAEIPV